MMISKINMHIASGDLHDDDGIFHDTVDFELNTLRCYVLWTPEGLMAQVCNSNVECLH